MLFRDLPSSNPYQSVAMSTYEKLAPFLCLSQSSNNFSKNQFLASNFILPRTLHCRMSQPKFFLKFKQIGLVVWHQFNVRKKIHKGKMIYSTHYSNAMRSYI